MNRSLSSLFRLAGVLLVLGSASALADTPATHAQIVVYGGTPAGVMAAVAAARNGNTVVLVDINRHLGGMVSGGLNATDVGDRASIGGLSNEFFTRVTKYYTDKYGAGSKQVQCTHAGFFFEPHVAEEIYDTMVAEQAPRITVWKGYRYKSVEVKGDKIVSLTCDNPFDGKTQTFTGDLFVDASYEGDVMAGAKVPYRVGREARSEYNEYDAGVVWPLSERGQADKRIMAYNYRMCLTFNPENRVLFPKPANYDPTAGPADKGKSAMKAKTFGSLFVDFVGQTEPNDKLDANWCDMVGITDAYPDGDWATRDKIAAMQRDHSQSIMWYLQNDPSLPAEFHADAQNWGFPKDEFTDNGNFPFQFYVREARRMVGAYVINEKDISQDRYKPDGIATGSYGVDCHVIRFVNVDGKPKPDATRHFLDPDFDIPYACLVPKDTITNLIVPVCLSATHVAVASIRMEPVYMMLGHAAGDAAHLAIANKTDVQKVNVDELRALLRKEGAILDMGYQPPVKVTFTPANPKVGEKVHFTVAETSKLLNPLEEISWDFDGNGKVSATGKEADHAFTTEKTYNVHLLVRDGKDYKKLVICPVPVGAAPEKDLMVHAIDADGFLDWDAGYPYVRGHARRFADVFFGPCVVMDKVARGKKKDATSTFTPKLPGPGRYEVCVSFCANPNQAGNTPVTIVHDGKTETVKLDQKTSQTPFPLLSLGEFQFSGDGKESVSISNTGADGDVTFGSVHWVWLGDKA